MGAERDVALSPFSPRLAWVTIKASGSTDSEGTANRLIQPLLLCYHIHRIDRSTIVQFSLFSHITYITWYNIKKSVDTWQGSPEETTRLIGSGPPSLREINT